MTRSFSSFHAIFWLRKVAAYPRAKSRSQAGPRYPLLQHKCYRNTARYSDSSARLLQGVALQRSPWSSRTRTTGTCCSLAPSVLRVVDAMRPRLVSERSLLHCGRDRPAVKFRLRSVMWKQFAKLSALYARNSSKCCNRLSWLEQPFPAEAQVLLKLPLQPASGRHTQADLGGSRSFHQQPSTHQIDLNYRYVKAG